MTAVVPKHTALLRRQIYILYIVCGTQFNHRFPFSVSRFLELRGAGVAVMDDVDDVKNRLLDHHFSVFILQLKNPVAAK